MHPHWRGRQLPPHASASRITAHYINMRAFGYSKHGPAAVQEVFSNLPLPEIGNVATGLRIKVHAASFNPIDFKRRSGELKLFAPERKWPVVLGYDCSGTVESVGSGVTKFKVGDAVYARVNGIPQYPGCGTCAEYTLATEEVAAPKPANMSWEEAAAVPLAAMTALQMLRKAGMKEGDAVFVTAGAGGVGHFAIQIAKAMGASRVVASASAAKHALLKELGADEVIDYRTQDYTQVFTDRPFDIALDNVAEVTKLCKIVKRGGWVVSNVQGFTGQTLEEATGNKVNFLLRGVLYLMRFGVERAAAQAGVSVNGMFLKPNSDDLRFLTGLIEANKVKAVVNVFEGFDKAADAMAMLEGGRTTGKVVVKIAP